MAHKVPQKKLFFEETEDDHESRKYGKFDEIEEIMPQLPSHRQPSIIDTLTGYLGSRNPFSHPVDPNRDEVWLFDNTAGQPSPGAPWRSEFVVAYFLKNSGTDIGNIVADLAEKIGIAKGDKAEEIMAERLQPLVDSILPSHTVNVEIAGKVHRLGPGDRDGISNTILDITGDYKDGQSITSHAVGIPNSTPLTTTFATATGWAVISDIDDTIKFTQTSDAIGVLRTTFAEPFRPIEGMPDLYKQITKQLDNPPFWYLSASPYNLYPFLQAFRNQFYPPGTLLLREASWMNLAGFLASLTQGTQKYKVDAMEKVHKNFPKRKFLCVGDSTQSDPEAYGEMARKYPQWVGQVWVRKVKGIAGMDEARKNSDERFEKAFEGVERSKWVVFEDPNELQERVQGLGDA
ncbi:hypothetical protein K402DRAFT_396175 [Aulographum hederae CBS 113979]|uniref:Phosphatidate phosphatase APP1 catalytic domain-containing protein n=1 Tax=Aulographum hederae CBS 113979 TaxID=1176131 RepID=A0A6G1GT53_9PEZI|nr:hypothetical protein K402DRAFT_396175 [Aulographum hederae CBS 113979]